MGEEICEELNECIEDQEDREVISEPHHSYSKGHHHTTSTTPAPEPAQLQSKRSVAEALELLDDAEKKEMADTLDVDVSKLSELSEEIADSENDHHTEEGNSRQKRGLLGLHLLKKHLVVRP